MSNKHCYSDKRADSELPIAFCYKVKARTDVKPVSSSFSIEIGFGLYRDKQNARSYFEVGRMLSEITLSRQPENVLNKVFVRLDKKIVRLCKKIVEINDKSKKGSKK